MGNLDKVVAFEPGKVSDPPSSTGNSETGQTQVNPPAGQDASSATQPSYITLEAAEKLAREAEERAYWRAEKLVRSADKRISGKVQADLAALEKMINVQKSAGIEITPMQEAQLRNKVISDAYSQADPPPTHTEQQEKPNPEAPSSEAIDPTTAQAWRLMKAAGITINEDDPEVKLVDNSDEDHFLLSIAAAIETKRQRIASTPMQAPGRTPTGAGATGAHQANPIQDITDPAELLRIAKTQGLW